MRGVLNGFLYHKTNKKSLDCALFCCVLCFPVYFFRSLAASYVIYNHGT